MSFDLKVLKTCGTKGVPVPIPAKIEVTSAVGDARSTPRIINTSVVATVEMMIEKAAMTILESCLKR